MEWGVFSFSLFLFHWQRMAFLVGFDDQSSKASVKLLEESFVLLLDAAMLEPLREEGCGEDDANDDHPEG